MAPPLISSFSIIHFFLQEVAINKINSDRIDNEEIVLRIIFFVFVDSKFIIFFLIRKLFFSKFKILA